MPFPSISHSNSLPTDFAQEFDPIDWSDVDNIPTVGLKKTAGSWNENWPISGPKQAGVLDGFSWVPWKIMYELAILSG